MQNNLELYSYIDLFLSVYFMQQNNNKFCIIGGDDFLQNLNNKYTKYKCFYSFNYQC